MSRDGGPEFTTGRLDLLSSLTEARVGLGRAGASLPTQDVLRFGLAHAQARDAVHAPFSPEALAQALEPLGLPTIAVESAAPTRLDYLRRPDLGRSLSSASHDRLNALHGRFDLAIVIGDGLSATAVHRHAAGFLGVLLPRIAAASLAMAPVAIASQARVALGDEAAEALGARMVLMVIGERPGLSSPYSLGAYLTYAPGLGTTDADRNCVSNIRPGGLSGEAAAFKVAWLIEQAFKLSLTGVMLKDGSDAALSRPGHPGLLGG